MSSSWLARRAEAEGGRLRFDRFMQLALYDPEEGYYVTRTHPVGRRGDFSTSATLSNRLAGAIAAWAKSEAAGLRLTRPHLIELGGGDGSLGRAVLRRLPWWPRFRYHVVEISPRLQAVQRALLQGWRVHWHTDAESAVRASGGQAILFSNEFVDAFPCRRFLRTRHGWQEAFFCHEDGAWHERWLEAKNLPDSSALMNAPNFAEGQTVEVHESYARWLPRVAGALLHGSILTIDYGGSTGEIYRRCPAGTVRAYSHHHRLTGLDVYRNPGRQDLTADVNFDDLIRWGSGAGLVPIDYQTQREFLLAGRPGGQKTPADDFLADSEGAGTAFKVLHQRRGASRQAAMTAT